NPLDLSEARTLYLQRYLLLMDGTCRNGDCSARLHDAINHRPILYVMECLEKGQTTCSDLHQLEAPISQEKDAAYFESIRLYIRVAAALIVNHPVGTTPDGVKQRRQAESAAW